ncbi:MAG: VCBS repeat-containing protein, partial [Proteobacteria bacterium]|nr:VCBS repeat-containing protein [Pseudomonadota bacterium]
MTCLSLIVSAALATPVPFSGVSNIATLDTPIGAELADLDGDGTLDLIVMAFGTPGLSVYLNSNDNFANLDSPLTEGSTGYADVAIGDLDKNGELDFVTTNFASDEIYWWQRYGPSFTPILVTSEFDGPDDVEVVDLDRDGDLDILAVGTYANEAAWWENKFDDPVPDTSDTGNPAISWIKHSIDSALTLPNGVGAADFYLDGVLDVVVIDQSDNAYWWRNDNLVGTAWQKFTAASVTNPGALRIADFDGDGAVDFATAADGIAWHKNQVGSWSSNVLADSSYYSGVAIGAADLDGDGHCDVVSGSSSSGYFDWWENTVGDFSLFTEYDVDTSYDLYIVETADLDGDGDLDLLSSDDDNVGVRFNESLHRTVDFQGSITLDQNLIDATQIVEGDIDGDGRIDFAIVDTVSDELVWYGDGGFGYDKHVAMGGSTGVNSVDVVDLDRDGDLDLVYTATSKVGWIENTNLGSAWTFHTVEDLTAVEPNFVRAGDVDGDGDPDVVVSMDENWIYFYENLGAAGFSLATHSIVSPVALDVGDIDRDGDLDVAVASSDVTVELQWLENAGNGTSWTNNTIVTGKDGSRIALVDLDGDGDLDVVETSYTSGEVSWAENTDGAGGSWTRRSIDTGATNAFDVLPLDFDADGDFDVVATSSALNRVGFYENLGGASTWSASNLVFDSAYALGGADSDNDGDLDLVLGSNGLNLLENNGAHYSITGANVAPIDWQNDDWQEIISFEVEHLGRLGDAAVHLDAVLLHFAYDNGTPMDEFLASQLIDAVE